MLVLRSTSPEERLKLRRPDGLPAGSSPTDPVLLLPPHHVDRALIQAAVAPGGQQTYRARYLLSRIGSPILDVELPTPPASLGLEVLLDGRILPKVQSVNDRGEESATGNTARLHLEPSLYRKPTVLDIRYQIAVREGGSRWQLSVVRRARGNVRCGPSAGPWGLTLPPDWVALCPSTGTTMEQRIGWPRPAAGTTAVGHGPGPGTLVPRRQRRRRRQPFRPPTCLFAGQSGTAPPVARPATGVADALFAGLGGSG